MIYDVEADYEKCKVGGGKYSLNTSHIFYYIHISLVHNHNELTNPS